MAENLGNGLLVGLTGGIAAGKSTVATMLANCGAAIVDADQLARDVTAPNSQTLAQIAGLLGSQAIGADGQLDRSYVGARVFSDVNLRRALEHITHPAIAALSQQRIAACFSQGFRIVVYEAPLLIEAGRASEMDVVVVVIADEEVRRQRLKTRNGWSDEEATDRMHAQLPQSEKVKFADYVIDNSGSLEHTQQQVNDLWRTLSQLSRA